MKDINAMGMNQTAQTISNKGDSQRVGMIDYFLVECFDSDGNLKWRDTIKNLVTNQGLDYVLNATFKGQTQYSSWYVGLIDTTSTPAYTDTAANLPNSNGWNELVDYYSVSPTEPDNRPLLDLSGAGGTPAASAGSGNVTNSANKAVFVIESPAADVKGVFVTDGQPKGSNSGANVLYGVGQFDGGTKTGLNVGDTLNVTVTLQADSA